MGTTLYSVSRLTPAVDDWLSGPPEYLRSISNMLAEQISKELVGLYPVIVTEDQDEACKTIRSGGNVGPGDVYVISHSESSHSICVTQWKIAEQTSGPRWTATISRATGPNFGRPIEGAVRVVTLQRFPLRFPSTFLSTLHWRAAVLRAGADGKGPQTDNTLMHELENFTISIPALRKKVAERHALVNQLLSSSVAVMTATLTLAFCRLVLLYRRLRRYCSACNLDLQFLTYLLKDVSEIATSAHTSYCARLAELQAQSRAERILRHAEQETRGALLAVAEVLPDFQQRVRVQGCLARHNLAEMQGLLHTLKNEISARTPEDRLNAFLESLKEYSAPIEVELYRSRAFEIFHNHGFRNARMFLVQAHEQLRIRTRNSERESHTAVG